MVTTTRLKVTDMGCPDCVDKVEGGLRQVDGVSDVSASLMSQMVTVTHESVPRARLAEAIEESGYAVEVETGRAVFSVVDMECAGCAEKVERALRGVTGVAEVIPRVMSQTVSVEYDSGSVEVGDLVHAIQGCGVHGWRDIPRIGRAGEEAILERS
jgi:Cd2+/Zn2+-exporting ATPase